jgi:predicted nucleic acid-binding protein
MPRPRSTTSSTAAKVVNGCVRRSRGESEVAAPDLVDLEVLSSLRKSVARGDVTEGQADDALVDFGDLALVRYPATNLNERIWELRSILTPYDGHMSR